MISTFAYEIFKISILLYECPLGILCRRPQIFDVRLSVCACVPVRMDHFLDPKSAFEGRIWVLKKMKKGGVPLDTKCNLISMGIKVYRKMSILGRPRFGPFCGYFRYDVGDITVLRLSCAKAMKGQLALQV